MSQRTPETVYVCPTCYALVLEDNFDIRQHIDWHAETENA